MEWQIAAKPWGKLFFFINLAFYTAVEKNKTTPEIVCMYVINVEISPNSPGYLNRTHHIQYHAILFQIVILGCVKFLLWIPQW